MIYSFDLPSGVTWWDIISTRKRTSTDVLRRKFERYGEIGDAYIPRDRSTGGKTENISAKFGFRDERVRLNFKWNPYSSYDTKSDHTGLDLVLVL